MSDGKLFHVVGPATQNARLPKRSLYGGRPSPNFEYLNRESDYLISLKFDTWFDHVTASTLQTLRLRSQRSRSQRDVI